MGKAGKAKPVKLFIGFIFKQESFLREAQKILEKKFSKIDFQSPDFAFTHTDYYRDEFGSGLKRRFIGFERLIPAEELAKIKQQTKRIEKKLSKDKKRPVNIDPGYLNFSKVVLASTKDYSHRIYLGVGIYAEITLLYQNKSFKPLGWTYPDYRTPEYAGVFQALRENYCRQVKDL